MAFTHPPPPHRLLRGYAFDPSLSLILDTVDINNIVYKVPWEAPPTFGPGPVGEYLEVVDYDPTTGTLYEPVDLNDPHIVATDGLEPSESNPQFHQQFVYSVAMLTIKNFEKAIGRKILWAPRRLSNSRDYEEYVPRLRIYPHALRDANAYYSPLKKSLLFGYFAASPRDAARLMPGSLVFTCLSHDIIAHEVTHAILDGLHLHYNQATNPDVLAFHEAFADIVALFQHFSFPEVLKHQIAKTRGDLQKQNLLGELAHQFGTAIGGYGGLRDAIGKVDEVTGEWLPAVPEPTDYLRSLQPHERGSILVAAVFEAFLSIYKRRISDLLRIASGGTGVLPQGDLHPDLVNRLAEEASKTAKQVLRMCIRAIDYCPPVDITFGDYLRAIITADADVVPEDDQYYRLAFIDAFRRRGIYPEGIRTLSEESLLHPEISGMHLSDDSRGLIKIVSTFFRSFREDVLYVRDRKRMYDIAREYIRGERRDKNGDRMEIGLHERLLAKFVDAYEFEKLTGLVFNLQWKDFGIKKSRSYNAPSYQILNLRLVSRVGPDGDQVNQIVVSLVQRMGVVFKEGVFDRHFTPSESRRPPKGSFEVLGGSTLIFDLDTLELKYAISKPLLDPEELDHKRRVINHARIREQFQFQKEDFRLHAPDETRYFNGGFQNSFDEPFSILHKH